jgi:hypothetical protein
MVIKLVASETELTLRSDKDGWCEVDLFFGGRTVRLGADQQQLVIERFASGLERELKGDVAGVINGMDVVWVLSLSEEHGTIFAAGDGERRVIFFQEASGSLLGTVVLSAEDRARWLGQLSPAASTCRGPDGP